MIKIISWNVNGFRAVLGRGDFDFLKTHRPDILCVQETKATPEQVGEVLPEYPHHYWCSAERKGYSGTAVFSSVEPRDVSLGIGEKELDGEGRVITLDYGDCSLVTVYTPNAQRGLARLEYRMRWDAGFLRYLQGLDGSKPVIVCGDLNVAHQEIDLARPKGNRRNAGFTDEERQGFTNIVEAGFFDSFRHFTREGGHYTWWSYMGKSREKNVGWRIDYFSLSDRLKPRLKSAFILPDIKGSDHCPIGITLEGCIAS